MTKLICDYELPLFKFNVLNLKRIINPECFEEFEGQMELKRAGEDPLNSMKAHNPIIILHPENIIKQPYLINGTHRVIQAFKDGKDKVEGYLIDSDICSMCGMSKDYELLYRMMQKLDRKFEKRVRKL